MVQEGGKRLSESKGQKVYKWHLRRPVLVEDEFS